MVDYGDHSQPEAPVRDLGVGPKQYDINDLTGVVPKH